MKQDLQIFNLIKKEEDRQTSGIELIASENYVSDQVLEALGSICTNKYAEGYPGARYYGGCEIVDQIEQLAIDRLCELFEAEYANVQPHSGAQANMAVMMACIKPGETFMGLDLAHGGHLTHGSPVNMSGILYNAVAYGLSETTGMIDYDQMEQRALEHKPKLIIGGASAYSREWDYARMREIADKVGAILWVDMAHTAGLIAAGLISNPVKYAHIVTYTTHKTLRGPRGGVILCKEEFKEAIDKAVFPGIQGGPLMHIIAAKAQCFYEASTPTFKDYQRQVIKNVKAMEEVFISNDVKLVSGGSDNHMLLVNVKDSFSVTGKEAEIILEDIGVACNKNMIPFDTTKPSVTSGIRIGTPAMTTKGFKEEEFREVARIIISALSGMQRKEDLQARVKKLLRKSILNI